MGVNEIVLEAKGITKEFPGIRANDNVDLTLRKGRILALLGENGAGKSTLMNIIYGLYHADAGTISLKGREVSFVSPREAIRSGIGMVHQHFQLIPVMSVAENMVLGAEVTNGVFLDMREASRRVSELSEQYNLAVDPSAIIEELPVGMQQRVEIIKALYRDAEILILDEPTAVLTPQEVEDLFKVMRDLATKGVSIIFITHKLKEVLTVADEIVVMRDGRVVGKATPAESTQESLAAMMVGRDVLLRVEKGKAHPGGVVLDVQDLVAHDDRGHMAVDHVSLEVRAGEVLGVAGVQGNGQTELVEVLTGLRQADAGQVVVLGEDLTNASPRTVTAAGSGHVPENRHRFGMVSTYTVAENLVLNTYYAAPFASAPHYRQLPWVIVRYSAIFLTGFAVLSLLWEAIWNRVAWPVVLDQFGIVSFEDASRDNLGVPLLINMAVMLAMTFVFAYISHRVTTGLLKFLAGRDIPFFGAQNQNEAGGIMLARDRVDSYAESLVDKFDIRTPRIETEDGSRPNVQISGGSLSGGNQQKMVVAREFGRQPKLLIAAQPTRGIDVGSIEFIHQQIIAQRDASAAVLLVSAELDEITALSDRIAVIYKGQLVATVPAGSVTREQLGLLMAGAHAEDVLGRSAAVQAA